MGYSALRAGVGFIPFAIAMGIGLGVSSQLVSRFQPRVWSSPVARWWWRR